MVPVTAEQLDLAKLVTRLPFWEWRDGMLHGEIDPNDGEFAYFERAEDGRAPRSQYGNPRIPVLPDGATGGAMVLVLAKHLRASPMMTLGLILDRLTTQKHHDLSTLTLGEACAHAMARERA